MITDKLENSVNYPMGHAWTKAFAFLNTLDAKSSDGKYPIDGDNIFAVVMSYETKPPTDARFEAHKKYADIQTTLDGAEGISVINSEQLSVSEPYDAEKDLVFFDTPDYVPALVDVHRGSFVFLLPQDAHMPQLNVGPPRLIKKVVVKIAVSEFGL